MADTVNLPSATWTKVLDAALIERYPTISANYETVFWTTEADTAPTIAISRGTPIDRVEGSAMAVRESMTLPANRYLWLAPVSDLPTVASILLD